MCSSSSIIMPADYEMLVSHSPPVFNSYLSDYSSVRFNRDNISRYPRGTCRSASANSFLLPPKNNSNSLPSTITAPRRPCLVIRPDDTSSSSDEDPTSPTRLKKKVVFADDRGMSLTHVRIMTEPSNVPPLLNSRFLSEVTRGLTANPVANADPWEITFAQPASDYLEFRRQLDSGKVCLENVIIKESEESITGTVKVSNISFEKEVFVRCSTDSWKTHEDVFCKYVNNGSSSTMSAAYVLYDTFSFKITLPPKSRRIEFCVCYRCGGQEFWDNNNNNNYILIKKMYHESLNKTLSTNDLINAKIQNKESPKAAIKYPDAVHAKMEAWSEFASWNHLENSCPYW
ncbi:hypothetical protein ILUMI_12751 [Ignelater luminosus]|uniref:Protein phosphatase 1 regulatory subunit n=1 Tax=Ignelater luminosus TaxID=2038154 RepID=A0A8K0CTJ2_IGNLU|nr:hypothetical protein ILUMI_12751 [Ignelater luminosus]